MHRKGALLQGVAGGVIGRQAHVGVTPGDVILLSVGRTGLGLRLAVEVRQAFHLHVEVVDVDAVLGQLVAKEALGLVAGQDLVTAHE